MHSPNISPTPLRRARQLRTTAIFVALLGLAAACLVYWHGTRPADSADDFTLGTDSKVFNRQTQEAYGRQGQVIADLTDDLKQPGTQAFLIVLATGLLAAGCWYLADLSEAGEE